MQFDTDKDLKIERIIDIPAEKLWTCWTQAEHIPHFLFLNRIVLLSVK